MRTNHNSVGGSGTSMPRRKFLQIATAVSAATLPAVSEAAATETPQLPLTDEQQLEACVGQLKNILARMHGPMDRVAQLYTVRPNGGFSLWIDGFPRQPSIIVGEPEGGAI